MRIVVDTNVALSGLLWRGPPRRILDLVRQQAVTLCTSATLVAELAEVIARPKFRGRVQAAGLSAALLVQDYARIAEFVEPDRLDAPASRDPDDDDVLACALAARADFIVSGDRDLLELGAFRNVPILSPADALAELSRSRT
jgi:putative PIN family toxin of toxin-antitoxin system